MRRTQLALAAGVAATFTITVSAANAEGYSRLDRDKVAHWLQNLLGNKGHKPGKPLKTSLGDRPHYLVNDMDEGPLKDKLLSCSENTSRPSEFSIAHRGAPLQFPEHTKEAYTAGARQGAGVQECDVTFTKDKELVCRHSQCDLHTTTNILAFPELAAKCRKPFKPYDAATNTPASAECCTSDITLDEFKSLCGKMDAGNAKATTPEEYLKGGTADWRTDLYAQCGTLLTHKESIALFDGFGAKFTPELKEPSVEMPFDGLTQEGYAQKLVDEYKAAGIAPERVFAQSFLLDDVLYWIGSEPAFGKQAVYLDDRVDTPEGYTAAVASLPSLKSQGVNIVAPPIPGLLELDANGKIIPSEYATAAKDAGLDIITWSLERSGPVAAAAASSSEYYLATVKGAVNNDGDIYDVVHALAKDVGVRGIFSDWPATVTYYANCFGL
jgi:glycerophosphoryl diester phosphodiesterase